MVDVTLQRNHFTKSAPYCDEHRSICLAQNDLSKLLQSLFARRVNQEKIGKASEIKESLDLTRQPAQRQHAVVLFGKSSGQQESPKTRAADVDDLLEVEDKTRLAGLHQVCKPSPEFF